MEAALPFAAIQKASGEFSYSIYCGVMLSRPVFTGSALCVHPMQNSADNTNKEYFMDEKLVFYSVFCWLKVMVYVFVTPL